MRTIRAPRRARGRRRRRPDPRTRGRRGRAVPCSGTMARALLIVNPYASRVTEAGIERVVGVLGEVDVRRTERPGHATELAREADVEAIYVFSGDGGFNEVLNGADGRTPLGFVPGGGASVLPRALGLPRDPEAAARRLLEGRTRRIGLGRVNGRRFGFAVGRRARRGVRPARRRVRADDGARPRGQRPLRLDGAHGARRSALPARARARGARARVARRSRSPRTATRTRTSARCRSTSRRSRRSRTASTSSAHGGSRRARSRASSPMCCAAGDRNARATSSTRTTSTAPRSSATARSRSRRTARTSAT